MRLSILLALLLSVVLPSLADDHHGRGIAENKGTLRGLLSIPDSNLPNGLDSPNPLTEQRWVLFSFVRWKISWTLRRDALTSLPHGGGEILVDFPTSREFYLLYPAPNIVLDTSVYTMFDSGEQFGLFLSEFVREWRIIIGLLLTHMFLPFTRSGA